MAAEPQKREGPRNAFSFKINILGYMTVDNTMFLNSSAVADEPARRAAACITDSRQTAKYKNSHEPRTFMG